jgi:hypothetical protein
MGTTMTTEVMASPMMSEEATGDPVASTGLAVGAPSSPP